MEWILSKIRNTVILIIAVTLAIVCLEVVLNQDSKLELSNNTTIIVEIAVGVAIAVIVYRLTKIEKKRTDSEIKNIRDIVARLEAVSYTIEEERICRTDKNLQQLLGYNEDMRTLYGEIQTISSKNRENMLPPLSNLKSCYMKHTNTVDRTPVLDADESITKSLTITRSGNLDIYWQHDDWSNIILELKYMVDLKQTLELYVEKEKEKRAKLNSKYKSRFVQSE